jgi:hypothetical protein
VSPPAAYSEERIVEEPAIALFAEMGWRTASAVEEKFGAGGTLGRETSGEVVTAPLQDTRRNHAIQADPLPRAAGPYLRGPPPFARRRAGKRWRHGQRSVALRPAGGLARRVYRDDDPVHRTLQSEVSMPTRLAG